MTEILIDLPVSIVFTAPVPDVLTPCSLITPEPPAPPPGNIIYTPIAPGVTYEDLPLVEIVDTSPDQIIGCIHDTASNPQGRLNVLFPSAIAGDGVIERRNNDFWVYDGALWNNVGPTPGPTITVAQVVPAYNVIFVYQSRLRIQNVVTKFEYALTLLTEVPQLKVSVLLTAQRILSIEVPSIDVTIDSYIPLVAESLKVYVDAAGIAISAPIPLVGNQIGSSATTPAISIILAANAPFAGSYIVRPPLLGIATVAELPQVGAQIGSAARPPVVDISVQAVTPTFV